MRTLRPLLALVLVLACAAPLAAQLVPDASELTINGAPNSRQHQRRPTAAFYSGGFLVAWDDEVRGAMARRFDASAAPRGGAFALGANDPTPALPFIGAILLEAHDPALAVRADGSFLAAWVEQKVNRSADFFYENKWVISSQVVARFFDAQGTPASPSWVLSRAEGFALSPQVVATGTDSFLVSWQEGRRGSSSVHLRRVERQGPGDEVLVASRAGRPSIAAGGDGALVTFEKCCGAGGGAQIFGRLFRPSGRPNGDLFRVASDLPRGAHKPAVSGQPGGDFLVAYQRSVPGDERNTRVHGQLVSRRGVLVGGELPLSGGFGEAHSAPVVGALANGGWVVGWISWANRFPVAPTLAAFTPVGNAAGNPVYLNDGALAGAYVGLASSRDGRLLAAWEGFDESGSTYGVRARALRAPAH